MPRLEIQLMGAPQVKLGGELVDGIRSDKVLALLAYLAVEADHPNRREKLAGLLWPGYPETSARASLRRALADLRMAIADDSADPAYLQVTRQTIQFNNNSGTRVDVNDFLALTRKTEVVNNGAIQAGIEAAGIYQGDFMEGFSLADSPEFEEWLLLTREQLQRKALETLGWLRQSLEARGEYDRALEYAWQEVALDPLRESAQLGLMRLLAISGQRQAALAQYGSFQENLMQELGVQPSADIRELHRQIQLEEWPPVEGGQIRESRPPRAIGGCPYRGLAAFREEDAPYFFGRQAFTQRLLQGVQQPPQFAVILGPSGSGKSSVAHAGLLPRLREKEDWLVIRFRPGSRPFYSLAAALLPALEQKLSENDRLIESQKLANALMAGDITLNQILDRLRQVRRAAHCLLLIDQFEELYTLCQEQSVREHFLDMLLEVRASSQEAQKSHYAILLTMRADFMGEALSYRSFADVLQRDALMLGPMTRSELREAIEKPAEVQGAAFEEGLVERILEDVGREPGNLPLLEFSLTLLWDEINAGWLTHAIYEQIGGVRGALARYADRIFHEMGQENCEKAQRVFVQLVRPGDGTRDTRRVATRTEIGDPNWPLVQVLADRRLVVTGLDETGSETVEIVHEALIDNWQQLQEWVEADRSFRTWQERLRSAIRQWQAIGEDEGALLRGAPLAEAERWLAEKEPALSPDEIDFIRTSLDQEQQRQARREQNRRRIIVGLAGGLIITLLMAIFAGWQWRQAGQQRNSAVQAQATAQAERDLAERNLSSLLAARASSLLGIENDLGLLLSIESVRRLDAVEGWNNLYTMLEATSLIAHILPGHNEDVRSLAFDKNGDRLATGDKYGQIILWEVPTGRQLLKLPGSHSNQINSLVFTKTGLLASGGFDNKIRLWDMDSASANFGQQVGAPLEGHQGNIWSLAFSPDERQLASAGADGQVILWERIGETNSFTQIDALAPADDARTVTSLAYDPHGEYLAAGSSGGTITLWDLRENDPPATALHTTAGFISSVAFSPDGRMLASAGRDDAIQLWDADRSSATFGQPLGGPLVGHSDNIWALAFHPSGGLLASAGEDGEIRLWDLIPGSTTFRLRTETHHRATGSPVYALAFSPEGKHLASGGQNDLAILWDLSAENSLLQQLTSIDLAGSINWAAYSPETDLLAVPPYPHRTLTIYDMNSASPTYLKPLGSSSLAHAASIEAAAFGPDDKVLASASADQTIRLWDVDPASANFGQPLGAPLEGHSASIWAIDFSPDGQALASSGDEGVVRLWKTDGNLIQQIDVGVPDCTAVRFSPDGSRLSLGCYDGIRIWEIGPGSNASALSGLIQDEQGAGCTFVLEYNPDGKTMASGSCDNAIRIWDVETGSPSFGQMVGGPLLSHQARILDLAYSPSGRYLASSDYDGKIYIWDMQSRSVIDIPIPGLVEGLQSVVTVSFSPDGRLLTVVLDDGRIFRLNFDLQDWIAQACSRANRNLHADEWRQFFGDEPYRPTCQEIPAP